MPLNQSIDLSDGNYVMRVISFNTYSSIFNITEKISFLYYNDGSEDKYVEIEPGAYEIEQINQEVYRQNLKHTLYQIFLIHLLK